MTRGMTSTRALLLRDIRSTVAEVRGNAVRAERLDDKELSDSLRALADELDSVAGRAAAVSGVRA